MKPIRAFRGFVLWGAALLPVISPAAETRFTELTRKFANPPDQARVVTSTFFGGAGTEWLAAGGFQPDGTIVVAGVALGTELNLGPPAVVLGKEGFNRAPTRVPKLDRLRRPERDKDGNPKFETLGWNHPNATAFVARLSGDAKEIKSVTRFGWAAGGVTGAALDGQGNIYLCGPATEGIASVSADYQVLPVAESAPKTAGCYQIYLAKLSPDGAQALWVRHLKGASDAPQVSLDKAGRIRLQGPDLRVFEADGKLVSAVKLPGEPGGSLAVNPLDGTFARGGEHHWSTGREPYRDPTLNIYRPDGSLLYELYNWDGPLVGLNNLRLVSDTAIRGVLYDDEGNLVIHAWSDGGNSVAYREPNDLRAVSKKMEGLGMSAWGAGVLSCAYVIRIETKNYKITGGTTWLTYQRSVNKPNSARINSLAVARDGSVCFAGGATWGLIQTGNAIGGEPAGTYVTVLNKDCTSIRFSSALPACGQSEVNDSSAERARFGIATGTVNGRTLVMFLSGAVEKEAVYGVESGAPVTAARQDKFGGGLMDGHLLLLDLSAGGAAAK